MNSLRLGLLVFTSLLFPEVCLSGEKAFPLYIGQAVCRECHVVGQAARACSLESIPEHDRSHGALSKPEALEIALLCGVGDQPKESRICLGCHAAGAEEGPRWWLESFKIDDGVQCEACHGAGSRHVKAYRRPAAEPRLPTPFAIKRVDRSSCTNCHVKRTSHEEVLELGFRRRPADRLYKTPVNLAVSPDGRELYVVCEHSNSLIVVDVSSQKAVAEIAVGKRPHDVAVAPDGRTLYVTNRLSDSVTVINARTRRAVGQVPVGHEPHGVLTDPTGATIYVLNAGDDSISVLDADRLEETKRLAAGRGPWSAALGADGTTLHVTNVRPALGPYRDPPQSELTSVNTREGMVVDRDVVSGANMLQGVATVPGKDVVLFTLMRTKNLIPMTRLVQGWVITNGLGVRWPDGRIDQILLDEPHTHFPDPMDIAVSPDGRHALVTSGGADRVALVNVARLLQTITDSSNDERERVLPNHLGMSGRFVVKHISVGKNPRGVAYSPDGSHAYVANALDDSVTVIETTGYTARGKINLGGPVEITDIRWGERLFHSADMTFARQFSCRGCHPDGHMNGLGFDIEADGIGLSPVDNRTLRGIVDTAPFKWEGTNPSLDFQCGPRLAVFFTRLAPFTPAELEALVRYECTIERPHNPHRSPRGLTLAQRRGKDVFERAVDNRGSPIPPNQRCVNCHNTPYKTSRKQMAVGTTMWFDTPVDVEIDEMYGAEAFGELGAFLFADAGVEQKVLDVPHLINIHDSAPYLHNGSAATLEEIWTRYNMVEGHGLTGDMTRRQFNDLIAYLKAL